MGPATTVALDTAAATASRRKVERTRADADRLMPAGTIIAGRYRIVRSVGHGGMAYVYLARHVRNRTAVAVKVLRPDCHDLDRAIARFEAEALAAASVVHPNVVAVHDSGMLPSGLPFLVMEYLAGCSLAQLIETEGPLSWRRAKAIVTQVCAALGAAHARQIVHCDIKPANIVVDRGPRRRDFVKVVDFGIATSPIEHHVDDGAIGTPFFMAPEQSGRGRIDRRTDVYAVGVLLYVLLTGRSAAELSTWSTKAGARAQSSEQHKPSMGRAAQVIGRATATDPEHRYPTVEALADALVEPRALHRARILPSRVLGAAAGLTAMAWMAAHALAAVG